MSTESASVLEDLRARLSGETVDDISRRIGAEPAQTKQAIDAALPMLLAALGQEASDPKRAAGLRQAIQEDHDGLVVDNLHAYLSGEMAGRATDGEGIVSHVLGDRRDPATQALSSRSGLDFGTVASLLPLLAPIVMGMLGKKTQGGGGFSLDSIGDILGGDTRRAANEQPDLGDLLGQVLGGSGTGQGDIGDMLGSIFGKR
jgi:hypothetical protein